MANKYMTYLKNPLNLFLTLGSRGWLNWVSDERYIKLAHRIKLNEKLDLDNVITYNQKLQWLKLYNRNPLYTQLVDKYGVREYVANKIGGEYLIPLLGMWDKTDDINIETLPKQFVLKCTHDSGGLVICKDKNELNVDEAKRKLNKSMGHNYFWAQREWPYKNVEPRIIAEKYMVDEKTNELRDYKFFCFDGEVKAMFVATDRGVDTRFNFFDTDFNHIPLKQYYPNADSVKKIQKPRLFEEMKVIASKLSEDMPHVRVDLYEINGKIYFGELTFFHFSGWKKFEPRHYDELFGSWIDLPERPDKGVIK